MILTLSGYVMSSFALMIAIIVAVVVVCLPYNCNALASYEKKKPILRRIRSAIAPFSFLPWYEDGLNFDCTGCGKCCKVDGDVWLAPEEVDSIMSHLGYSSDAVDEFRNEYIRAEVSPSNSDVDSDQSQSWMCLKRKDDEACTFLNPIGQCSIYDVRPIQCRTYPFWPSILKNKQTWEEEAVLPDDINIKEGANDRHWSSESGGCEGISLTNEDSTTHDTITTSTDVKEDAEATIVQRQEIVSKMKAAKKHWKRFPIQEIKDTTWYL